MQKVNVNPNSPDSKLIAQAAELMKKGGLVVCPTDTVYIFAVNATNEEAIKKVYSIKGRDFNKPIHVVVRNWEMAESSCETNEVAKKLNDNFLPGPLTIVLPKKPQIPNILTADLPTLGIRIPNNLTIQQLSHVVTFPYTATSANKSGGPDTYSVDEVLTQLEEKDLSLIDLVLDAGDLPKVAPSTIINCSITPPRILRPGPITQGQIESALGTRVELL